MRSIFLLAAVSLALVACGKSDQDKLTDEQLNAAAGVEPERRPDDRCGSAATTQAVKLALFRRAAEVRGSAADAYGRIAGFALLALDDAQAADAPGTTADCRARATLRLPPNLHVAGGRTILTGSIGYSVGEGGRPVTLTDDDLVTIPLSTLSQSRSVSRPAPATAAPSAPAPAPVAPPTNATPDIAAAVPQPSFDCRRARSRSEEAVCRSVPLANLDQQMAARYRTALDRADPSEARLLRETLNRFLGYRERCRDDGCIANTYRGRMREIDDIMTGRWQPAR